MERTVFILLLHSEHVKQKVKTMQMREMSWNGQDIAFIAICVQGNVIE